MARRGDGVDIRGLDEFRDELAQLTDPDTLRSALADDAYKAAEDLASRARERASGEGRMAARAAETLRSTHGDDGASLSFGGHGAEFAAGSEFGAQHGQTRSTLRGDVTGWNQFQPWRGSGEGAGYWLYPTIRDATDSIEEIFADGLERILVDGAFPD